MQKSLLKQYFDNKKHDSFFLKNRRSALNQRAKRIITPKDREIGYCDELFANDLEDEYDDDEDE